MRSIQWVETDLQVYTEKDVVSNLTLLTFPYLNPTSIPTPSPRPKPLKLELRLVYGLLINPWCRVYKEVLGRGTRRVRYVPYPMFRILYPDLDLKKEVIIKKILHSTLCIPEEASFSTPTGPAGATSEASIAAPEAPSTPEAFGLSQGNQGRNEKDANQS